VVLLSFFWICVGGSAYELNRRMLEAYTFEKEQKKLEYIDKVFKKNEESILQDESK